MFSIYYFARPNTSKKEHLFNCSISHFLTSRRVHRGGSPWSRKLPRDVCLGSPLPQSHHISRFTTSMYRSLGLPLRRAPGTVWFRAISVASLLPRRLTWPYQCSLRFIRCDGRSSTSAFFRIDTLGWCSVRLTPRIQSSLHISVLLSSCSSFLLSVQHSPAYQRVGLVAVLYS